MFKLEDKLGTRWSTNIIAIRDYIVILFQILPLGQLLYVYNRLFGTDFFLWDSSDHTLSSCNSGTNAVDSRKE